MRAATTAAAPQAKVMLDTDVMTLGVVWADVVRIAILIFDTSLKHTLSRLRKASTAFREVVFVFHRPQRLLHHQQCLLAQRVSKLIRSSMGSIATTAGSTVRGTLSPVLSRPRMGRSTGIW